MAAVSFWKHERYPGLNIEITIDPALPGMHGEATASLIAQGDDGSLQIFIGDMTHWQERHHLLASKQRATKHVVYFAFELDSWSIIADFVVVWVGIDNLGDLLRDRQIVERYIFGEVRTLSMQMQTLNAKIDRLSATMG